jgi:hypothetical protein
MTRQAGGQHHGASYPHYGMSNRPGDLVTDEDKKGAK